MDSQLNERPQSRVESEEPSLPETPDDVATLYTWANLQGAKYRDFSASRREFRAQSRHRAAENVREVELRAQAQAEAAAETAERAAHEAARAANGHAGTQSIVSRDLALRAAEEASRKAAAERVEAARRAEAAAAAEASARREEREIAEANASAQRQAARYYDDPQREQNGPQPVPGALPQQPVPLLVPEPGRFRSSHAPLSTPERHFDHPIDMPFDRSPDLSFDRQEDPRFRPQEIRPESSRPGPSPVSNRLQSARALEGPTQSPAWLYASQPPPAAPPRPPAADTLQNSRERVAARWFALKGVFDPPEAGQVEVPAARPAQREGRTAIAAIFSLAGGVGKTSLVATLGRALSSMGERVLLTDTTSHGLLPFYFGANELRPGIVRTFSPPSGSTDAPVSLVSYDMDPSGYEPAQERLVEDALQSGRGANRLLFDLNGASAWVLRRLARLGPTVLIPVAPDMNSVISLQSVEKFFQNMIDLEGRPIQPFYLLSQFDPSLPLHLDVREVLGRQLGDRLLPFIIRRSPSVSEALAEGMTVVDYAPDSPIAEDYANVAGWLRKLSGASAPARRSARWSER